ncbi:aldose 1-epimerase [Pseudomonas zeae]|uniref:Aldose 1-epimerase n=1 Tax=Pseudomonas zeae TaxID=2745510 RepID=A0A9E6NNX4_9PSED|nr:aldose 1-epimerase [Pseudomonas zeae]QXI11236.1 aldose 1-epimerase [Pseudomonas zeae]
MNILRLRSGDLHLEVLPQLGGALGGLRHRDFALLRPWDRAPNVRRTGCYPLVPYSNRIAEGRFQYGASQYQVPRNFGEHAHPLHGVGWQREWQVIECSPRECHLRLSHDPAGEGGEHWPFAFQVEQYVSLDDHAMSLSMTLRNDSRQPMPAGLGWHPYFPRHQGIELSFAAKAIWLNSSDSLPRERLPVPPQWDFDQRRALGHVGLDNCFEGWQRHAGLYWPQADIGLEITAQEGLDHLVVFTPAAPTDFIAVEPVSHLNNAINLPAPQANGIVLLSPGEHMTRTMHMSVRQYALGAKV